MCHRSLVDVTAPNSVLDVVVDCRPMYIDNYVVSVSVLLFVYHMKNVDLYNSPAYDNQFFKITVDILKRYTESYNFTQQDR